MMNEAVTAWKNGQAMIALGYPTKDVELYRMGYLVGCCNPDTAKSVLSVISGVLGTLVMGLEDGLDDLQGEY